MDRNIRQGIDPLAAEIFIVGSGGMLVGRVYPNAAVTPHHAQQSLVVHGIKQMRSGVR